MNSQTVVFRSPHRARCHRKQKVDFYFDPEHTAVLVTDEPGLFGR